MFIQSEETPNPNTLKFLPGVEVVKTGTFDFTNLEEAKKSNIANLIFSIEGIERVFLGDDFISVTKSDSKIGFIKPFRPNNSNYGTIRAVSLY